MAFVPRQSQTQSPLSLRPYISELSLPPSPSLSLSPSLSVGCEDKRVPTLVLGCRLINMWLPILKANQTESHTVPRSLHQLCWTHARFPAAAPPFLHNFVQCKTLTGVVAPTADPPEGESRPPRTTYTPLNAGK